MCSCEFLEISKKIFFAEHHLVILIIAVSEVVKGELANETVNYDTKAYVPIWARSVSYQKKAVLLKREQVVHRFSSK